METDFLNLGNIFLVVFDISRGKVIFCEIEFSKRWKDILFIIDFSKEIGPRN